MLIIFRKEFPKHSRLRDQDVRGCGFSWSRLQLAQRYLEEGGREGAREGGRLSVSRSERVYCVRRRATELGLRVFPQDHMSTQGK